MATDTPKDYLKCAHKTPEEFIGAAPNSKTLIVSSGESTGRLLKYKDRLREKFDVIVCVNYAFREFDDVIDYHIVVERQKSTDPITVPGALDEKAYRTDIPRIVNWNGIDLYDQKYNLYKTTRSNFFYKPDIRKYRHNGSEGLLYWKPKSKGWSSGTATLSAMHFCTLLGSSEIYIIGCDLCFKSKYDHYYQDQIYRNKEFLKKIQPKHRMDIVEVTLGDRILQSTNLFKDAAETIDELIPTVFNGIKIYDFSDGLLKTPAKLDIDEFMK